MELMWAVLITLATGSFCAPMTSRNITLRCKEFRGIPMPQAFAPNPLAELKASLSVENGLTMLDVSWAVRIDNTLKYIEGIDIYTSQEKQKCEYIPTFAEAINRSLIPETQEQIWFHHKIHMLSADYYHVQAANLPLPPSTNGLAYKEVIVFPPRKTDPFTEFSDEDTTPRYVTTPAPDTRGRSPLLVPVCGGLIVGLALLIFCIITYKVASGSLTAGFQTVGPEVPVLVVYPAESALFQGAVVALAEFLQRHGGCGVAIDLWQQGGVAKLGPMRWLLEQVHAAHRVLLVAPQPSSPPSLLKQSLPGLSLPPATAQDLFPLALNLVAGRAKNSTELAKFWVVRFGETAPLPSALQACRTFCLMKDLDKLCAGLQSHRPDKTWRIADLLLRRHNWCGRNGTEKLRAAVQALTQASASPDQDSDKCSKLVP